MSDCAEICKMDGTLTNGRAYVNVHVRRCDQQREVKKEKMLQREDANTRMHCTAHNASTTTHELCCFKSLIKRCLKRYSDS